MVRESNLKIMNLVSGEIYQTLLPLSCSDVNNKAFGKAFSVPIGTVLVVISTNKFDKTDRAYEICAISNGSIIWFIIYATEIQNYFKHIEL